MQFFFLDVHNNYILVDGNIGTKYTRKMLLFFGIQKISRYWQWEWSVKLKSQSNINDLEKKQERDTILFCT